MSKRKVLAFVAAFSVAIPLALSGAAEARVGSQTTGISSSEIKVGAVCVYHLLTWVDGRFDFSGVEVEMEDEVQASTTHLLMEGARLIDEQNR